jgi:hypothetical protein
MSFGEKTGIKESSDGKKVICPTTIGSKEAATRIFS